MIVAFLVLGYASTGQWFLSSSFCSLLSRDVSSAAASSESDARRPRELANPLILSRGAVERSSPWAEGASSAAAAQLLAAGAFPLGGSTLAIHSIRYIVMLAVANLLLAGVTLAAMPNDSHARGHRAAQSGDLGQATCWIPASSSRRAPQTIYESRVKASANAARIRRTLILASMGSLGHMHESSAIGSTCATYTKAMVTQIEASAARACQ